MNRLTVICLVAAMFCLVWQLTTAPAWAQNDLNGAWKIVEVSGYEADGTPFKIENIQPSLFLFQNGYYSITLVSGNEARPLEPEGATREELTAELAAAIWIPFVSNAGTYEVSGSTLKVTPMVALSPAFMEGGSMTYTYKVEKDMLTMSGEQPDGTKVTNKLKRLQ